MGECKEISLRKMDTTQSWGFKLKGGVDMGMPLHLENVGATVLLPGKCQPSFLATTCSV